MYDKWWVLVRARLVARLTVKTIQEVRVRETLPQAGPESPGAQWAAVDRIVRGGLAGRSAMAQLLADVLPRMKDHLLYHRHIPAQDADDLIQEFVWRRILAGNLLASASRARGSKVTSFLVATLDHFVAGELRLRLSHREASMDPFLIMARSSGGGEALDEAVNPANVSRIVQQTLARMQAECAFKHREDLWYVFGSRILRPVLDDQVQVSYGELAGTLGCPVSRARLLLETAKRMFRRILRRVIADQFRSDAGAMETGRYVRTQAARHPGFRSLAAAT